MATIAAGGLATGVTAGSTTIQAISGGISGSTGLTVTAATLVSIAVSPANPSIAKGATKQFTATGTYSDSSTQNLTASATWSSTSTGVATIAAGGLATGATAGSTTIQATSGGISGSTGLTVTAATLVSVAVSPANPSIAKGATEQFTATGTYSDGSTQNLTASATWSSTNTGVATIAAGGLATGATAGSATIQATSGGISGSRRLDQLGIPARSAADTLSGGQAAQLGLAVALGTRAKVLLLDEPLANLDPLARREFIQVLLDAVKSDGSTALLSSHIVTDVEDACDRLAILAVARFVSTARSRKPKYPPPHRCRLAASGRDGRGFVPGQRREDRHDPVAARAGRGRG